MSEFESNVCGIPCIIRGQMISPADNYDWHLIKAVLAKAKEKNT